MRKVAEHLAIDESIVDDLVAICVNPATADGPARHAAARALTDWIACALGGCQHPLRAMVAGAVAADSGPRGAGPCTLVGSTLRAPASAAALHNGAISHLLDYDDISPRMVGHPGVVVFPTLLALAELAGRSTDEVLDGAVAGYSAAEYLGLRVNPQHYEAGWHATGTLGALAAAAAAARLLRLPAKAVSSAIAAAAAPAALRASFGSHGKALNAGRAASTAVSAALLASTGVEVPAGVLVGPAGYLALLGAAQEHEPSRVGQVSDERLLPRAIQRAAVKMHAACGATHSTIDAVARLVRTHGLAPEEITGIEAVVHPIAVKAAGKVDPKTALEAKFSVQHLAALAVFRYPIGPDSFEDGVFDAEPVLRLRSTVDVRVDPDLVYDEAMPATVTVTTARGQVTCQVDTPKGRPSNPASDGDLLEKVSAQGAGVLPEPTSRSLHAVLDLLLRGGSSDLSDLTSCLS